MKANIIKPKERLKIPEFDISKLVNDEYNEYDEVPHRYDSTSHDTYVKESYDN